MFEFHGWATLRHSYEWKNSEENYEQEQAEFKQALAKLKARLEADFPFYSNLNAENGEWLLSISGGSNHYRSPPVELFEFLSVNLPGSFGLLYTMNDEDQDGWSDRYQVWVLKRGTISRQPDPFLSPISTEIEIYVGVDQP